MFCMNCGSKILDGAKFCPVCGAQQSSQSANVEFTPDSENDTVYLGVPNSQPDGEADTVFMGTPDAAPGFVSSSEEDTIFMGSAQQNNIFGRTEIPTPAQPTRNKPKRNTSYESSNIGMSTPRKVIIIVGLVIIAALIVYLVFDFMSV